MQKCVYVVSTILAVTATMLAMGCQNISTSHTSEVIGSRLPASDPNQVEILNDAPTRKYGRVGEVRAVCDIDENFKAIAKALAKEAAKLGADAVVVVKQGVHAAGGGVTKRVVIGVAIKLL